MKVEDPRKNPQAWYLTCSIHTLPRKELYNCLACLETAMDMVNPAQIEVYYLLMSRAIDCRFYLDDKPKQRRYRMENDRLFDPKDDRFGVIVATGPKQ